MRPSGQIPQRVQAAWRDDRGAGYFSVLFVMVLALTAVASLSLLIDGGRIAGARRQADMISFQAARAAAQALDEGALYHGEVVVVTDAAADAAAAATGDLLARAGLEGRMTGIDVRGTTHHRHRGRRPRPHRVHPLRSFHRHRHRLGHHPRRCRCHQRGDPAAMNTPARPRPLRVLAAGAAIGVAVLAAGALIAVVTQAITGRASPLPTTPPWRWSLDAIAHWFSTDATSSGAVDVAVRVLALVAWLALALIAVNLLRELAHQARHGVMRRRPDPVAVAPGRPSTSARPGRVRVRRQHGFASTIVAILLGGSTLVAPTATALPARVPAAAAVGDAPLTGGAAETPDALADPADDSELPAGWQWGTHTVTSPHESLASIARHLGDDPTIARTIWDANQGRDMGTGERFSDPAVVKVGWTLRVPTDRQLAPIVAPAAEGPAAPSETTAVPVASPASHVVVTEPGDTMWDQIDEVVDTPTATDVAAVAEANDGTTTPLGPWVFDADNPDLIHAGMPFDLQPAIDLHNPPTPIEVPPPDAPAATPTGGNESATAEAPTPAAAHRDRAALGRRRPRSPQPRSRRRRPRRRVPSIRRPPPTPHHPHHRARCPPRTSSSRRRHPQPCPGPSAAGAAPAVQPGDVAATPPAGPPVDDP